MGQKNHPTSWDKKKSPNLAGQKKINQPQGQKIKQLLGTKISPNLLRQKKNHLKFWDKKVTQPLRAKIITQPLWTKKNHPTSRVKKSTNHSGQKTITQLLGTKNIIQWLKLL